MEGAQPLDSSQSQSYAHLMIPGTFLVTISIQLYVFQGEMISTGLSPRRLRGWASYESGCASRLSSGWEKPNFTL